MRIEFYDIGSVLERHIGENSHTDSNISALDLYFFAFAACFQLAKEKIWPVSLFTNKAWRKIILVRARIGGLMDC